MLLFGFILEQRVRRDSISDVTILEAAARVLARVPGSHTITGDFPCYLETLTNPGPATERGLPSDGRGISLHHLANWKRDQGNVWTCRRDIVIHAGSWCTKNYSIKTDALVWAFS